MSRHDGSPGSDRRGAQGLRPGVLRPGPERGASERPVHPVCLLLREDGRGRCRSGHVSRGSRPRRRNLWIRGRRDLDARESAHRADGEGPAPGESLLHPDDDCGYDIRPDLDRHGCQGAELRDRVGLFFGGTRHWERVPGDPGRRGGCDDHGRRRGGAEPDRAGGLLLDEGPVDTERRARKGQPALRCGAGRLCFG